MAIERDRATVLASNCSRVMTVALCPICSGAVLEYYEWTVEINVIRALKDIVFYPAVENGSSFPYLTLVDIHFIT